MTLILRTLFLLAGAMLLQAHAPAGPRPLRQPVKPWLLDYGDTACTASRTYGSLEAPITLAFRPSPSGKVVRLTLIRPEKAAAAAQFPVSTNITAKAASALRFASSDGVNAIFWVNFERAALDRLPAAGEIALRNSGSIDERLALPGMTEVLKALGTCNSDLRQYWNVDGAEVKLSKPAASLKPLFQYFTSDDYPDAAARKDAGGTSQVTIMVDEKGAAKDCLVEKSSGVATLDATTCGRILQRARFKPALDMAGKPARSVLTTQVIWRIADEW